MNQKKAKALRRELKAAGLPESQLVINKSTGQMRRGWGERAAYNRLKNLSEEKQRVLLDGLRKMVQR